MFGCQAPVRSESYGPGMVFSEHHVTNFFAHTKLEIDLESYLTSPFIYLAVFFFWCFLVLDSS